MGEHHGRLASLCVLPLGVFVSLRTLKGPLDRVKEENPLLFRKFTAECHKLGFPEIIRPCEFFYTQDMLGLETVLLGLEMRMLG